MKRFTETGKWRDPWFRRLSPIAKLLWAYFDDICDPVGVIDLDIEAASFDIGATVEQHHIKELGDRIAHVSGTKYFIYKFIPFQYGRLSVDCAAHRPIFKLLEKYGSSQETAFIASLYPTATLSHVGKPTLSIPIANPIPTPEPPLKPKSDPAKKEEMQVQRVLAEEIYQAYPKKVARPVAITSILKALEKVPFKELLEKVTLFSGSVVGKEERFIPNPSTFFNQERYNDNVATSSEFTTKVISVVYNVKDFVNRKLVPTPLDVEVRFDSNGRPDWASVPTEPYEIRVAVEDRLVEMGLY